MRHHFLREKINSGEIIFEYVETEKMIADILTKALSKCKHVYCVKEMGIAPKTFRVSISIKNWFLSR